jgi:hypothetical protein
MAAVCQPLATSRPKIERVNVLQKDFSLDRDQCAESGATHGDAATSHANWLERIARVHARHEDAKRNFPTTFVRRRSAEHGRAF